MRQRDVGRIVRITRWDDAAHSRYGEWWGVVNWEHGLRHGELGVSLLPPLPEWAFGAHDWVLVPHMDNWEVMRQRDVPDEVWAALAKWRLSQ